MRTFWNELLCAMLGHPGTWVAELDAARFTTTDNPPVSQGITMGRFAERPGELRPWRCSRCRRTLAEIRNDYSIEPDWLKKLGW